MQDYFRFSGRLNRRPYWLRHLALYAVAFAIIALPMVLLNGFGMFEKPGSSTVNILVTILVGAVLIIVLAASAAMQVRRLHDRNKSGWWLLFFAVLPIIAEAGSAATLDPPLTLVGAAVSFGISIWYLIETGFLRGTSGPNRYGPDPLDAGDISDVFA